ncbi:adenosine deaminase, tRNA-specific 3 [Balamuthia mandrillaris]
MQEAHKKRKRAEEEEEDREETTGGSPMFCAVSESDAASSSASNSFEKESPAVGEEVATPRLSASEVAAQLHPVLSEEETRGLSLLEAMVMHVPLKEANALLGHLNKVMPLGKELGHLKRARRSVAPSSSCSPVNRHESKGEEEEEEEAVREAKTKTKQKKENMERVDRLSVLLCSKQKWLEENVAETLSAQINLLPSSSSAGGWEELMAAAVEEVSVPQHAPLTLQQYREWNMVWPIHARPVDKPEIWPNNWKERVLLSMPQHMQQAIELALCARANGMRAVGAVVVDPRTNRIIARGFDHSGRHHYHHRSQKQQLCPSLKIHPLKHAVIECIDEVARKELRDHPQRRNHYLCTDYHLYTTQEPCIMCSMAILHSRFARVIYACNNEERGGLGSKAKLHTHPSLNHKFEVYKGLLEDQCQRLLMSSEEGETLEEKEEEKGKDKEGIS